MKSHPSLNLLENNMKLPCKEEAPKEIEDGSFEKRIASMISLFSIPWSLMSENEERIVSFSTRFVCGTARRR